MSFFNKKFEHLTTFTPGRLDYGMASSSN